MPNTSLLPHVPHQNSLEYNTSSTTAGQESFVFYTETITLIFFFFKWICVKGRDTHNTKTRFHNILEKFLNVERKKGQNEL